jgi:hypothetical protein
LQIDPSLAFNNPVPAADPSQPQQSRALAPVTALAAAPAPEVAPAPVAQALSAPAPEVARNLPAPPTPAPTQTLTPASRLTTGCSSGTTPSNRTGSSAAGGSGGNSTVVPSFNRAGQEYFITIGPDGNFQNGCQTFFPSGWNQCVRLRTLLHESTSFVTTSM